MKRVIEQVPGVESAQVSFEEKTAKVTLAKGTPNDDAVLKTIESALAKTKQYKVAGT